jgi:hypothetical protein
LRFPLALDGCRGGNTSALAAAKCPIAAFIFLALRCRYITANLGLSTIFSPGAAGRHTLRRSPDEKAAIYSRCDPVQPLPMLSRGPRAMPTGGLLRPEFGNKPSNE